MVISEKCNCCAHEPVCKLKDEYLEVCRTIKKASLTHKTDANGTTYVNDSAHFSVSVCCRRFMEKKPTMRGATE